MAEVTPPPVSAWAKYWMVLLVIAAVATFSAVAFIAPVQIPVIVYKVHLVCLGVLLGYVANEAFLHINNEIAQAIIILAVLHGLTGGL